MSGGAMSKTQTVTEWRCAIRRSAEASVRLHGGDDKWELRQELVVVYRHGRLSWTSLCIVTGHRHKHGEV